MRIICLLFLCMTCLLQAATEGHHFYFFYKEPNDRTKTMEKVFDSVVNRLGDTITATKVNITDPQQKPLIERFHLRRSPMPFTLVVAENGAVTGGYPMAITESQLMNALSSHGQADCLKALQERKMVILCMHQGDENAMAGVRDFASDPRFAKATEILQIDASDIREHKFLQQLGLDVHTGLPLTALIAPPAKLVGSYVGATTKDQFISDLGTACKNCCPGGCCANGCCGPK